MTDVAGIARDVFGWSELRPGQREAMEALVAGRDVIAVLPTGAGKSAIYQVPALVRRGPTIVVSPLIALQQDQHASVSAVGDGAVQVNAAVPAGEREAALDAARGADAEFVFVTPEQLADPAVLRTLAAGRPSLVAVDEAHCVSTWGHDFRPDYRQLGHAIEALGHPPVAALTATAAPPVRDDIIELLGLQDPLVVVHGLDRPNIDLDVRTFADTAAREDAVVEHVFALPRPGIVYVGTRREADGVAVALGGPAGSAPRVSAYHAGMSGSRRSSVQEAFMEGSLDAVVATNAFGMGIDKADIRWVLHATTPDSPDAYLQELGRAGRDGDPAWSILLHHPADLALRRFLSGGLPAQERLVAVALAVADAPGCSRTDLMQATGLGRQALGRALQLLEQVASILRDGRGRYHPAGPAPEEAGRAARAQAERHQQVVRSRIALMRDYVATTRCRRQFLLGAMGERLDRPCGACDTCRTGTAARVAPGLAEPAPDDPLAVAARVTHPHWGPGVVMDLAEQTVTVLFDSVGYRTLARDLVLAKGLLEPG
jgi:RecQ family ATP-dependent DNA helicase